MPPLVADIACTALVRSGPGAPAPSHPPQPSPHGSDANCSGDQVSDDFPTLTCPGNAPRLPDPPPVHVDNCLDSKFSSANSLTVSFMDNSPPGITCDNTASPSKTLLINMGGMPFEKVSVSRGDVIEQTRMPQTT